MSISKLLIFLLLLFPCFCQGREYFSSFRERAAKIKLYSAEDFALGEELIAEMRRMGLNRQPVFEKPHFIMEVVSWRCGRLYDTSNYWYDRQLFADRRLWEASPSPFKVPGIIRTYELMQDYGVGCSFFSGTSYERNARMFYQAAEKFSGLIVLPTLHVAAKPFPEAVLFRQAVENPHALKIDGKGVFFTYDCDRLSPEELEKYLIKLQEKAGRSDFTVIPEMSGHYQKFGWKHNRLTWLTSLYTQNGKISAIQLLHCFDVLTRYLRISGGLDLPTYSGRSDHSLNVELYENLLLPLFSAVCAREEFNGKKALLFQVMHCYTSYHGSQSLQADGTGTIRSYLDLCDRYKVDILLGFEWDELNEGTNLEPTVARPMALQKIIRYWNDKKQEKAASSNGRKEEWLPELIISQRRQINLGSELKIELLNVPDCDVDESYEVILELLDEDDQVLHTAPAMRFFRRRLMAEELILPSEKFAAAKLIRPRLQIIRQGESRIISGGLPFTVIRPSVCNDQTWFNTPLRNILVPESADVSFFAPMEIFPGVTGFTVDAGLKFKEKITAVEIVQNSNSIFAWDPCNEYLQHDPERALFRINCRYLNNPAYLTHTLQFSSSGTASLKSFSDGENPALPSGMISGFPGEVKTASDVWVKAKLFSLRKSEIENAVITIRGKRLSGVWRDRDFEVSFPLKHVGDYGVISHVLEDGLVFSVERLYRPVRLPLPLDRRELAFRAAAVSDNPDSVVALRLISADGKVWWSKAFVPFRGEYSGKMVNVNAWSDTRGMISFAIPRERQVSIDYNFTPLYGNILTTSAGKEFFAHAGSYLSLATGFEGTLGSRYTVPGCHLTNREPNQLNTPAPSWEKDENGNDTLYFDGKNGNFLAFSSSVIPQRSAFTMEFELKPLDLKREQLLFCQYGPSYQCGFSLRVKEGKLQIGFRRRTQNAADPGMLTFDSIVTLKENCWQKVSFSYDGFWVSVAANGRRSSFPCTGIPLWSSVSSFGGDTAGKKGEVPHFYHGWLRSMKIIHGHGEKEL